MNTSKTACPTVIEGIFGPKNISKYWKNHFYRFLCGVNRHKRNNNGIQTYDNNMIVTVNDINNTIKELSKGKYPRPDNICAEHLIFSGNFISVYISILFSNF